MNKVAAILILGMFILFIVIFSSLKSELDNAHELLEKENVKIEKSISVNRKSIKGL